MDGFTSHNEDDTIDFPSKIRLEDAFSLGRKTSLGLGWGAFDRIHNEASHYFVDEDDANRFFSAFSSQILSAEGQEISVTPVGVDHCYELSNARSSNPRLRKYSAEDNDNVASASKASISQDSIYDEKVEPLEGNRRLRRKQRSPRRHRSTSRDVDGKEEDAQARERRRRRRRHRSSSRDNEEDDLIRLTSAVLLGDASMSNLSLITERQRKKDLERKKSKSPFLSQSGHRVHQRPTGDKSLDELSLQDLE